MVIRLQRIVKNLSFHDTITTIHNGSICVNRNIFSMMSEACSFRTLTIAYEMRVASDTILYCLCRLATNSAKPHRELVPGSTSEPFLSKHLGHLLNLAPVFSFFFYSCFVFLYSGPI